MRCLRNHVILWVALFLAAASSAMANPPTVNGTVEQVGPFRLVRVWGTPAEMGFAHGYLLADGITTVLNERVAALPQETRAGYDGFVGQILPFIEIPERTMQELRGIIEGIEAKKGKLPTLQALGRPLGINDLVFNNAGDMVRAFGCSGFTVWGELAGKHGVLTTRNFDYPSASPEMQAEHMLLVRHPEGRKQVLSVTWPSYIGAFTGVNEDGVCAFMHDGTGGLIPTPDRKRIPLALVLADTLEQTTPGMAVKDVQAAMKRLRSYPFSYMVRLATPRVDGLDPGYVFRIDKKGIGSNPPNSNSCITTNHYLTGSDKPVPEANEWSLTRYKTLQQHLASTMTRETAWAAQDAVASDHQGFPTLHTLIVYPESRMLDLAFAEWKNGKVIPATKSEPTTIKFDDLFKPHE